jgi:outer membrane protein
MKKRWLFILPALWGPAAFVLADGVTPSTATVTIATGTAISPLGVVTMDSDAVHVLDLPSSIQLALNHATNVLKAENLFTFTGVQLWQAYLEFLPAVTADANYTWTKGRAYYTITSPTVVDTRSHGATYELAANLNIFNGFADYSGLNASQQRRANASLSLFRAKQQIILDVTQAYLQVLLDQQLVRINESNLQASQEREKLLNAQADAGIRSLADLYRQEAQTSADSLALINARNQARTDLILLLRRLRVDLSQHYTIADVVLDTPPTADPYNDEHVLLERAIQQRADLSASRANAKAASWDVTTARAGYYPRLDLEGSLQGTGDILSRQVVNGVDDLPASQDSLNTQLRDHILYNGGFALTWGLFERYETRLAVARAQLTAKNAGIDYEDLLLQVEGDVQQSMGDYHSALDQLSVASVGVKAAQESMDAVSARYGVGASNIVDLLTAQSALVQAQASDAQARIGYMLENKTLENILGDTKIPL